jgi:hypothetical protein
MALTTLLMRTSGGCGGAAVRDEVGNVARLAGRELDGDTSPCDGRRAGHQRASVPAALREFIAGLRVGVNAGRRRPSCSLLT